MKIYLINGRSEAVGQWYVEIFTSKFEAIKAFKQYMDEYEARLEYEDDDLYDDSDYHCAVVDDRPSDVFWVESRTI